MVAYKNTSAINLSSIAPDSFHTSPNVSGDVAKKVGKLTRHLHLGSILVLFVKFYESEIVVSKK